MPLPSLPREEAWHEETSHLFPKRVKGFPGSLLATAGRIAGLGGCLPSVCPHTDAQDLEKAWQ